MTTSSARSTVAARPGLVSRLKLSEPVRLYAYGVLTAIVAALLTTGTLTGSWPQAGLGIAAAVLAVVPGAEAARASVYSPQSHVRGLVEAAASPMKVTVPRAMDPMDVADRIRAAGL